jgi:hypothetical protein
VQTLSQPALQPAARSNLIVSILMANIQIVSACSTFEISSWSCQLLSPMHTICNDMCFPCHFLCARAAIMYKSPSIYSSYAHQLLVQMPRMTSHFTDRGFLHQAPMINTITHDKPPAAQHGAWAPAEFMPAPLPTTLIVTHACSNQAEEICSSQDHLSRPKTVSHSCHLCSDVWPRAAARSSQSIRLRA